MRITLGRVPRQRLRKAEGPERRERRVGRRVVERDCWRRVFRRSAGWRRVALRIPVVRPARKWNSVGEAVIRFGDLVKDQGEKDGGMVLDEERGFWVTSLDMS